MTHGVTNTHDHLTAREQAARQRAHQLITWADALEDSDTGGKFRGHARDTARDLIHALDTIALERGARQTAQANAKAAQELLGRRAAAAARSAA